MANPLLKTISSKKIPINSGPTKAIKSFGIGLFQGAKVDSKL